MRSRGRSGRLRKFLAEEWPEHPSLRFLIYWSLRRRELCDREIGCPHEDAGTECPLDRLKSDYAGTHGKLIQAAIDLKSALSAGLTLSASEIAADEYQALLILDEEVKRFESEKDK